MQFLKLTYDKGFAISISNDFAYLIGDINLGYSEIQDLELIDVEESQLHLIKFNTSSKDKVCDIDDLDFLEDISGESIFLKDDDKHIREKKIRNKISINDSFITILVDEESFYLTTSSLIDKTLEQIKNDFWGLDYKLNISYCWKHHATIFETDDNLEGNVNSIRRIESKFKTNDLLAFDTIEYIVESKDDEEIIYSGYQNANNRDLTNKLKEYYNVDKILSKDDVIVNNYLDSFDNLEETINFDLN